LGVSELVQMVQFSLGWGKWRFSLKWKWIGQ